MKRIKLCALILALTAALSAAPALAGALPSEDGFYIISSAEDMTLFASMVNGGSSDLRARLAKDIDLSGKSFVPIGTDETRPFCGIFDGAGHSVSSLSNGSSRSAGLFGFISYDGAVKNLSVKSADIFCDGKGPYAVGALASENRGVIDGCTLEDSAVTVTAAPLGEPLSIGAAVGVNSDGMIIGLTVKNCLVRSAVPAADRYIAAGAAVGTAIANTKESGILQGVTSLSNSVSLLASSDDAMVYAGLVAGMSNGASFKDCSVIGGRAAVPLFNGEGAALGGIAGSSMPDTYLENCNVADALLSSAGGKTPVLMGGIAGEFVCSAAAGCYIDGLSADCRPALPNNIGGAAGMMVGSVLKGCYVLSASLPKPGMGMINVGAMAGMVVAAETPDGVRESSIEECGFLKDIAEGHTAGLTDGGYGLEAKAMEAGELPAGRREKIR
jgi:hypothetical protein